MFIQNVYILGNIYWERAEYKTLTWFYFEECEKTATINILVLQFNIFCKQYLSKP